jgi:hypothetical protein
VSIGADHPWRAKQAFADGVRREKETDTISTSAYWQGGALHPLSMGKPYADYIEYIARMQGKLYGKWTGVFCPKEFKDDLISVGALDAGP